MTSHTNSLTKGSQEHREFFSSFNSVLQHVFPHYNATRSKLYLSLIPKYQKKGEKTKSYRELGHSSFRKLVCMNPGSRQPTALAGAPTHFLAYIKILRMEKKPAKICHAKELIQTNNSHHLTIKTLLIYCLISP